MLVSLKNRSRHRSQIYNEIPNLAIELILVDIPLSATATRDIRIVINQGDSREAGVPLNNRLVIWIANKLSIVIPTGVLSSANFFSPGRWGTGTSCGTKKKKLTRGGREKLTVL